MTGYLHTGWFSAFNLADVFITVGAAVTRFTETQTNSL
ncbi:lipoprotein signal peptidase [Brevibacterium pityocampae]